MWRVCVVDSTLRGSTNQGVCVLCLFLDRYDDRGGGGGHGSRYAIGGTYIPDGKLRRRESRGRSASLLSVMPRS